MATGRSDSVARRSTKDLIIVRTYNAPRQLVWKAWTDPEMMMQWWGPKDFTAPVVKIDLREGGKYLYCMHGKGLDGVERDFWVTGEYREIVTFSKLVMTDSFADASGNVVPASYYGMTGEFPLEVLITLLLEDRAVGTRMTLRHSGLPEGTMKDLTGVGWNESFDKLETALQKGMGGK